jgi:hypothetical protein
LLELRDLRFDRRLFRFRHLADLTARPDHFIEPGTFRQNLAILACGLCQGLEFGIFLGQPDECVAFGSRREAALQCLEPLENTLDLFRLENAHRVLFAPMPLKCKPPSRGRWAAWPDALSSLTRQLRYA